MASIPERNSADYIVPLSIGGLEGRMLRIPANPKKSKKELLFIYGHHASLERSWGLMEVLNEYGAVTMPDLPGFGGMDSFYKLGQKPTIDNLADYLAAFIKWRYKRKKVIVAGMSFGFVVVTRMLQRYPELTSKIDMCISIVGFSHRDDFIFPVWKRRLLRGIGWVFSNRLPAAILRGLVLNPPLLGAIYKVENHEKFRDADKQEFNRRLDMEVRLWRKNDVRTHMFTMYEFLDVDNCTQQINLPVYHLAVEGDRYFDNDIVEQHLRIIFSDFKAVATLDLVNHAPSVIATADEAASFVPRELRRLLSK